MANKAISELPQALNVNNQDLFVLEQGGLAKKLPAETFITEQGIIDALAEALDGHGGIQSVTLSSISGRIRTYLITFTDQSATTFQVLDGTTIERIAKTSEAGLVSTYTIFMSDGTTSFFNVSNGADGDVSEATLNRELAKKAPVIAETVSSTAIASFADGADDMPIQSLVADIDPVQDLTYGDPYPAGGGKNIANYPQMISDGAVKQADGSLYIATASTFTKKVIYQNDGTAGRFAITFIVKNNSTSRGLYPVIVYTDSTTENMSVNLGYDTYTTFTKVSQSAKTIDKIIFNYGTGSVATWFYVQVEKGDTATAWSPYANICPITGHTEVNVWVESTHDTSADATATVSLGDTYYGGTLDVVTGTLTVTDAVIDSYAGETLPSTWISDRDVYAEGATPTTGAQVVYKLATSQTYQLSGQQLKTLYGNNTVWADTGNVTVTYPADTKMYIDNAIAALA